MELQIEYLPVKALKPYENNARSHEIEDVSAIANSIKEFGFDDPIGIWGEVASQKAGISEREIVARAAAKVNIKTENMAGHISKYARSNYGETIAEASADVFCNGEKASVASRAIMSEIKSILK